MAQVTITINSREYAIACENGQEARIMQLASILDEKAQLLKNISGRISENMLLAMIGILVADDLVEALKKQSLSPQENNIIATSDINNIDEQIAHHIRLVCEQIKSIANEIEKL